MARSRRWGLVTLFAAGLGGCGDAAVEVAPGGSAADGTTDPSSTTAAGPITTTITTSGGPTSSTTSTSSATSGSTTDGLGPVRVAEELVVDLDGADPSADSDVWINRGSGSDFVRQASPRIVDVDGITAIDFNVEEGDNDLFRSEQNAPATLIGLDPTRSVEVWALNPSIQDEETLVSWSRRGGPDGTMAAYLYGSQDEYGAVSHWNTDLDIGWLSEPEPGVWHLLAYTFDGTTIRVFVDGQLDGEKTLPPGSIDTPDGFPITIGAQNEPDLEPQRAYSGYIARIRVHAGVLSPADVAANFELERSDFGR